MDFLKILPMAFVMIAGPQIISSFFFATSSSWKRISAAYVLGAATSIALVVGASYLLRQGAGGSEKGDSGLTTTDYVILVLLAFAIVHTYLNRNESEPPKWMGKLQSATPKTALVLGFLLLGFFPSDLITSISIGGFLSEHGDPYLHMLPFLFLTLLFLSLPALMVLILGKRGEALLPKIRDWMDRNSWVVSEFVLVFFIAIILSN